MRHFKHLSFNDRLNIEAWQKVGVSVSKMAEMLGVHISTIYRELKRGTYERLNSDLTTVERYSPDKAEQQYREHLKAKGAQLKIGSDYRFAEYIEEKIVKDKYSPCAVLGEIKAKGIEFKTTICPATLYSYIDKGIFLRLTNKDLPVKRNKTKRQYHRVKAARRSKGESIERRPAEIAKRSSFGHWEMDCVEGAKGTKRTLLVLTERQTRREIVRAMPAKTAANVVKALDGIEQRIGTDIFKRLFLTITVDNGSEFMDCAGMERSCTDGQRTKLYYCHPYSSYERGSNENQNKLVRRHYPKGTSFEHVTDMAIADLEEWINNYPRLIFGYCSAGELFNKHLEIIGIKSFCDC